MPLTEIEEKRKNLFGSEERKNVEFIYGHVVFEMLMDLPSDVIEMYKFEAQKK